MMNYLDKTRQKSEIDTQPYPLTMLFQFNEEKEKRAFTLLTMRFDLAEGLSTGKFWKVTRRLYILRNYQLLNMNSSSNSTYDRVSCHRMRKLSSLTKCSIVRKGAVSIRKTQSNKGCKLRQKECLRKRQQCFAADP